MPYVVVRGGTQPEPPPVALKTNCGAIISDQKEDDGVKGFSAGMGVFAFSALCMTVWLCMNHFWYKIHDSCKFLLGVIVVHFIIIGALAGGMVAFKNKCAKDRVKNWPIKADEKDLCVAFQEYKFLADNYNVADNVSVIPLPPNSVISQIIITGTPRNTIDLMVERKSDNHTLIIPLDVTMLRTKDMQCNYDAVFTSELYNVQFNVGTPCKISYAYTSILPEHIDYINNHGIIARQCENKLLYVSDDHKSFDTTQVFCEL